MRSFLIGFVILFINLHFAQALSLKLEATGEISHNLKFQNTVIGGLSGVNFHEGVLYAISDDPGRVSEPRFYSFSFTQKGNKIELQPKTLAFTDHNKKFFKPNTFLDQEGLAPAAGEMFYVSTEGRMNNIPRQAAKIFKIQKNGKVENELEIPEKYSPEVTGEQKKGIQNNLGFEGLSKAQTEEKLYAMTEAPLYQDINLNTPILTRMLEWNLTGTAAPIAEYLYPVSPLSQNSKGIEVFRGVSEILEISDKKFFVLERGVRLTKTFKKTYTASLYVVDFSEATNVLTLTKTPAESTKYAQKTKVFDFETDLDDANTKDVQNVEALTWGPKLKDGQKTLLVVSDNNFTKTEKTEIHMFSVGP